MTLITSVPSSELVSQISLQHSINVSTKRRKKNIDAFILYPCLSARAGGSHLKHSAHGSLDYFWFLVEKFSSHTSCSVNLDAICKTLRPDSDNEKKISSYGQRYQVEACMFMEKPRYKFC